ncbi:aldolase/citrate lyase family protein [Paenibacillus filicis]|uniref:Aldolase/citrate lyase family protein n=1 Tax=Paenibacillus gyeongsangnamensis TaxID=3388067 RepID=A0ABT4Q4C4_9BACL|nr:aldolase/citrate lyase family protein [Paenibacillus filicis]MCZ8511730.1 aldolase/citrate lyase family protein [Paenibacillus filicis]
MFKETLQKGSTVFGIWQRIPSSAVSEILSVAGVDFAAVDMEHGPIDISDLRTIVPVFKSNSIPVLLRIPSAHLSLIAKALDLDVDGIIVPQVSTAAEAEAAVAASKFSPIGKRGIGGPCAADHYGDISAEKFTDIANDRVVTIVQIENQQAVGNLDEILEVTGIDLFYIGPFDLSQSLGITGQMDHPLLIETIQFVIDKLITKGIPIGMHGVNGEFIKYWRNRGASLFTYGMDNAFLKNSVRSAFESLSSNINSTD